MYIRTRDSAPGAATSSLLYRRKSSCKVRQQVQKIFHNRCPAGHPEPLRPCGEEEIVRVRSSLLGVENRGKGKALFVYCFTQDGKEASEHLLYEGQAFTFYQGKGKNHVSTQYSVSLVSEISNSKRWTNLLLEVIVEMPFFALK